VVLVRSATARMLRLMMEATLPKNIALRFSKMNVFPAGLVPGNLTAAALILTSIYVLKLLSMKEILPSTFILAT